MPTKEIGDVYHTFRQFYEHRTILFALVCNSNPDISWKSKRHYDEENDPMFDGDFVAGINTLLGIATYHLKLKYWDLFKVKEIDRAYQYDGYSSDDVINRLTSLIFEKQNIKRYTNEVDEKYSNT